MKNLGNYNIGWLLLVVIMFVIGFCIQGGNSPPNTDAVANFTNLIDLKTDMQVTPYDTDNIAFAITNEMFKINAGLGYSDKLSYQYSPIIDRENISLPETPTISLYKPPNYKNNILTISAGLGYPTVIPEYLNNS